MSNIGKFNIWSMFYSELELWNEVILVELES
jgi:hypothetical protein